MSVVRNYSSDKLFKQPLHSPELKGFFPSFFPEAVIAPVGEQEPQQKKKEEEVKNC